MQLPHKERIRFCSEVSKINKKMNAEANGNGNKNRVNIFDV